MLTKNKRPNGGRMRGGGFQQTATFRRASAANSVTHFNASDFDLGFAEFEQDGEDALIKQALIMVEGDHVDSKKRPHRFPAQRIKRIFNNTVAFLAGGGRVPWQQDHQKTQDANIGDLEFHAPGDLELRVITKSDLPKPSLRHLVGKLGIFANRLVAKGADVIEQIEAGRIKTLSPGIDTQDDIIREISATPIPAIAGLSTFRMYDDQPGPLARFALTFEEAEAEQADMDALKEEFMGLGETFWTVMTSIQQATEEELQDGTPDEYMQQAIASYNDRIWELFNPPMPDPQAMQPNGVPMQGQQTPNGFSAFTLDGVEAELATFRRSRRGRGSRMRERALGRTRAGRLTRAAGLAAALGGAGYLATRGRGKRKVNLKTANIYTGPEPKKARRIRSFSQSQGDDMRLLTLDAVEQEMLRAPAEFARRRGKRGKSGGLRQRLVGRTRLGKAVRLGAALGAGAVAGRALSHGELGYKVGRAFGESRGTSARRAVGSMGKGLRQDVANAAGALDRAVRPKARSMKQAASGARTRIGSMASSARSRMGRKRRTQIS